MPGGDRMGPNGMGPMTGRGAGYCAGNTVPGYANSAPGRGRGWGRGRGFGWGRGRGFGWGRRMAGYPMQTGWAVPYSPELSVKEEANILKEQAEFLKQQLKDIQDHISALEKAQTRENK